MARDGAVHLLLVLAAVMVVVSYAENANENINVAANDAPEKASWAEWVMDKASDAVHDAIEMSEYWAEWVMDKFAGFGLGKEEAGKMTAKAKETVSDIKEMAGKMATTAKEPVSNIASSFAKPLYNMLSEFGYPSASSSGAEGRESAKEAYEVTKERSSDALGDMGGVLRNSEIRDYDVDDEL